MTTLTETVGTGEFLCGEYAGDYRIRASATILTGGNYPAGKVLGKVSASSKYTEHTPGASDGSQNAAAILYAAVDSTGGDKTGVIITQPCEVFGNLLTWKSGISGGDKTTGLAALATLGFVVRT
jgi:hypothetical protein